MILEFDSIHGLFVWMAPYHYSHYAKNAGFSYSKPHRMWVTDSAESATKLKEYATPGAVDAIEVFMKKERLSRFESHATGADIEIPRPDGLEFMPFQKAGVKFMVARPNSLLADQMGLGKTIQAIGFANIKCPSSVLIICPASLKRNWLKEWNKWSTQKTRAGIASSQSWPDTPVIIVNYDILVRLHEKLISKKWDLLIMDEAHYVKNPKAKRTKHLIGSIPDKIKGIEAEHKIAITGTPILNRPIEIYTLLKYLDPMSWPNRFEFAKRYCNAKKTRFGWDFNGASNLPELQTKLRSRLMIRRMKADVLTELPPKQRQVIELDPKGATGIRKAWKSIAKNLGIDSSKEVLTDEEYNAVIRELSSNMKEQGEHYSTIRRETGIKKIDLVADHIKEAVEASEKVVVFAHHTEVVNRLRSEFGGECVTLVGSTPEKQRQEAVDRFQHDPSIKVFIGNILAAGVGITLTASNHVIFCELDWVPGNISQAEDRCHRIGTTGNVLIQHLVMADSIDSIMAKTIVHKQNVIDMATNVKVDPELLIMLES